MPSSQTMQNVCQIVAAVSFIVTAVAGYGAYYFDKRVEAERDARTAMSGTLEQPTETLLSAMDTAMAELEIGQSGTVFLFGKGDGSTNVKMLEDNKLRVTLHDGAVRVSLLVRDRTGAVVAELVDNEWKVNPQRSFDRNYLHDALEVRDASGDVVLQVRVRGRRVHLQAKLFTPSGEQIALIEGPKGTGANLFRSPQGEVITERISPMFKYPSERHLGKLEAR